MPQSGASLGDDARVVIYDRNMFKMQATGVIFTTFQFLGNPRIRPKARVFVNDNPFQPSVISYFSLLGTSCKLQRKN